MDDGLWAAFATAGFTCWAPDPVTVRPVPGGGPVGTFPFSGPVTFVTADNPTGRPLTGEENAARRCELADFLDAISQRWHPAVGGDPDGEHLEPGAVVLGLDLPAAAVLGARFGQAAVYVWEEAALHLLACTGDRHEILGYRATKGTRLRAPVLRP